MGIPVKLSEILNAMEMQTDECSAWLDKQSGEMLCFMGGEFAAAEMAEDDGLEGCSEWEPEAVEQARAILDDASGRFLKLPTKFDIHEYRIMERFCLACGDGAIASELSRAIRGRGAFRCFKDVLYRHGIQQKWFDYRAEALRQIAIEWCEAEAVTWVDE